MISPLDRENFDRVKPVFSRMADHLAAITLLDGIVPGAIYSDHPNHPQSALAQVQGRFFLAGHPNEAFSLDVRDLLTSKIFPEAKNAGKQWFSLYPDQIEWGAQVEEVILKDFYPIRTLRQYYRYEPNGPEKQVILPPGFKLQPVDRSLLKRGELQNLEELVEELQSERPSVEAFLEHSFGTCLIHGDTLVSWCLSEYNLGSRCEVGIATDESYQRKGLATLTGTAFLLEAQKRGFNEIGWHCFANNAGSAATALKLGFQKQADYLGYLATIFTA